jgi:DNA repair exonuclease SbcCD ATPase subunit
VGVVTHIAELAAQLPARVEVQKSERGSRVVVS